MSNDDLQESVRHSLATYFDVLGENEPTDLHNMLIKAVEAPLLQMVMARAEHNQSRAAQWLGLNRNTLRKKLLEHGLIE